jgi:hypothetical protein
MGEPEHRADDPADDVFAVAAEHYARDYESRISCLWPFVIIPLLAVSALGAAAYFIFWIVTR